MKPAPERTQLVHTVPAEIETVLERLLLLTRAGVAASVCNHGYRNYAAASAAAGNADTGATVEPGISVAGHCPGS